MQELKGCLLALLPSAGVRNKPLIRFYRKTFKCHRKLTCFFRTPIGIDSFEYVSRRLYVERVNNCEGLDLQISVTRALRRLKTSNKVNHRTDIRRVPIEHRCISPFVADF